ncbi:hypothetical protein P7C70_g5147, partial [Phenoliferia sp. Uapishka_3]
MLYRRIVLTITPPIAPATTFRPGDVVRAIVSNPGDYTSLRLKLIGETITPTKLRPRSVSFLSCQQEMGTDLVTSTQRMIGSLGEREESETAELACFLELDFVEVTGYALAEQEKMGRQSSGQEELKIGRAFEVRIPEAAVGQLMPTFSPKSQTKGGAPMEVKYCVQLEGTRRQMFHLKDKTTISIPVSYPSFAMSSSNLSASSTGFLKMVGVGTEKPKVEAAVSILLQKAGKTNEPDFCSREFSYEPLNFTGDVLRMRLVANLVGSRQTFADLSSAPIVAQARISRKLYSRRQSNDSEGDGFTFDAHIFGATTLKLVAEASNSGQMVWEGDIKILKEERTVVCDWMKIYQRTASKVASSIGDTIGGAINYASESAQSVLSGASKEGNKEVAKGNTDASLTDRASAAFKAGGDKLDETSHDAKAEANKQQAKVSPRCSSKASRS